MQVECAKCGVELPVGAGLDAEVDRRNLEDYYSTPMPIIGALCPACEEEMQTFSESIE